MATFSFESHRKDVTRKAEAARREVAYLYRDDGTPRNTPDEHREQMARRLAPLQQAVAAAQEHAQAAQAEAKRLEGLQNADPLSSLSTEELIRLNAARELAKDEISRLVGPLLRARLATVAESNDRVSQILHLLYAGSAVKESGDGALHRQLAAIDEAVYGKERSKATKAVEEAQTLRKQAAELSFYAGDTLSEIDGSKAAAFEQKRAEYAAAF